MGMNSKTRLMFNLSYIHSYIEDILEICSESDYNYPLIFTDKKSQYAINMCFVQIGEHCAQIRDIDRTFFDNQELRLYETEYDNYIEEKNEEPEEDLEWRPRL